MSLDEARAAREQAEAELTEARELTEAVFQFSATLRATVAAVERTRELRRLASLTSPSLNGTHGGAK